MNLLLVRSHQAEIIIVKHRIPERKNVARAKIEPNLCDQGRRKNNAFTLLSRPRCRRYIVLLRLKSPYAYEANSSCYQQKVKMNNQKLFVIEWPKYLYAGAKSLIGFDCFATSQVIYSCTLHKILRQASTEILEFNINLRHM